MPHINRLLLAILLAALLSSGGLVAIRLMAGPGQPIGTGLPDTRFAPRSGQIYLGVSTHGIMDGVDGWSRAAGISGHPALYGRWTKPNGAFSPILDEVSTRPGITPIVHWNLPFTGGRVSGGSRDPDIKAQAAAVKAYRKPVFVRLNWEMNATWYPGWNAPAVSPMQFVESWRHVVKLFADVPNVAFVWAPNVLDPHGYKTAQWYPGDDYVDWMGLDAYPQSAPATTLLNGAGGMEEQAKFAEQHNKPLMLAEWAVNSPHPDSADPINLVFDWAARHPVVRALVYFDFDLSSKDFRLATHPIAAAAFRARTVGKKNFLLSLTGETAPPTTSGSPRVTGTSSPTPTKSGDPSPSPSPSPSPGHSSKPTPTPTATPPPQGNTGLDPPTHLIGTQDYTSVALGWRPVNTAARYEVYRDGNRIGETTGTRFEDTGLRNGVPHTWTVAAIDQRDVPGELSAPFKITPGRWGTHAHPCTYGPSHKPCRYPSEGPALIP
jgi:hypothetical protein